MSAVDLDALYPGDRRTLQQQLWERDGKIEADADLLVTDEIQAVLDAAVSFAANTEVRSIWPWHHFTALTDAIDAYLASRQGS